MKISHQTINKSNKKRELKKVGHWSLRLRNFKRGFTIVELVVAMTIFAILSLLVIDFYINITRIYLGSLSARSAQQNIRVAMETISRYIKQGREIEEIEFDAQGVASDRLSLRTKDDPESGGAVHTVRFLKTCEPDPYARDDFVCIGRNGGNRTIGIIRMGLDETDESNFQPLTSTNLNITEFEIRPTPGIPLVLNLVIKAQIEEAGTGGKAWERGAGGGGEIEMTTAVALKGQYY